MTEILFLSDTHLGLDEPVHPRSSRPRRGPDFFANFHRCLDEARHRRVAAVIHGGDLFFRSKVPQVIVDRVYADIHAFLESGIPLLLLPGNHERSRLPASLFLAHPSLHVFDRPRTFRLELPEGSLAVGGIPSIRDGVRESFAGALEATGLAATPADFRWLCLHQALEGAVVGPADYVFRDGPDVVPLTALPAGLDAVLVGHIHRRQFQAYDDPVTGRPVPILYPGSVERTSFAEIDEPKGFLLLRVTGRAGPPTWEFCELPSRPMVDLEPPANIDPAGFAVWLTGHLASCPPRAVIRVRVPPSGAEVFKTCRSALPPGAILEYRLATGPGKEGRAEETGSTARAWDEDEG